MLRWEYSTAVARCQLAFPDAQLQVVNDRYLPEATEFPPLSQYLANMGQAGWEVINITRLGTKQVPNPALLIVFKRQITG